jgi:hypothetical protein
MPGVFERIRRSHGNRIKPTQDVGALSSYWEQFGPYSYHEAYLLEKVPTTMLVTQVGDKMVGGVIRVNGWKGALVLLPLVDFDLMVRDRRKQLPKGKKKPANKSQKAEISVGKQFVEALIQIDKVVRVESERTPAPQWLSENEYTLKDEVVLEAEIASIDQKIAELQTARIEADARVEAAGNLKGLLYETGLPLESAVLEALRLLGFKAGKLQRWHF